MTRVFITVRLQDGTLIGFDEASPEWVTDILANGEEFVLALLTEFMNDFEAYGIYFNELIYYYSDSVLIDFKKKQVIDIDYIHPLAEYIPKNWRRYYISPALDLSSHIGSLLR